MGFLLHYYNVILSDVIAAQVDGTLTSNIKVILFKKENSDTVMGKGKKMQCSNNHIAACARARMWKPEHYLT